MNEIERAQLQGAAIAFRFLFDWIADNDEYAQGRCEGRSAADKINYIHDKWLMRSTKSFFATQWAKFALKKTINWCGLGS